MSNRRKRRGSVVPAAPVIPAPYDPGHEDCPSCGLPADEVGELICGCEVYSHLCGITAASSDADVNAAPALEWFARTGDVIDPSQLHAHVENCPSPVP